MFIGEDVVYAMCVNCRYCRFCRFSNRQYRQKRQKRHFRQVMEKIDRIGYRCATDGLVMSYYEPVKNPL